MHNNPYRFFGVISNSGIKNIQKNLSKIRAYSKVGKHLSLTFELNFFNLKEIDRSESLIKVAENKILLDSNKVKHSLFWFCDASAIDKVALENLNSGNFEKSELIWRRVIKEKAISKTTFSAYNNLSTLLILKCLSDNKNDKLKNSKSTVCQITEALNLKSALIFSDQLQDLSSLICENENAISKEDLLTFFIESISSLLDENFSSSEISAIIKDSSKELSESFNLSLIKEPLDSLNELINDTSSRLKENPSKGLEIGKNLITKSISHHKLLKEILGENDLRYQSISDKLANQVMQCGILCFNETGDDKEYMSAYKYAKSISFKGSTIERANSTIEHCENELKANICGFCSSNEIQNKTLRVEMHKMNFDNTYSYFKNGGIEIKACGKCYSEVSNKKQATLLYTILTYAALNGITMLFQDGSLIPYVMILDIIIFRFWIFKSIHKSFREAYYKKVSCHPLILNLKTEGYKFGMP